jgi:hypothetical protein
MDFHLRKNLFNEPSRVNLFLFDGIVDRAEFVETKSCNEYYKIIPIFHLLKTSSTFLSFPAGW